MSRDAFRPRNAARPPSPARASRDTAAFKPREAPAERPAKKKAERPKFDVTCIECHTTAQVPFKPIEGRDVFCQPCYRARRGIVVAPEGVDAEPAAVAEQAQHAEHGSASEGGELEASTD